jgi:alkylation response protein AidB-like acyl-CoA dehydrogenase
MGPAMLAEPGPEQQAIAEAARRVIAAECDLSARLRDPAAAAAEAPRRWRGFAELGWLGLAIPEAHGGSGGTMRELWPLLVECGRGLVLDPLLPNLLGALALARCGGAHGLLERVVAGEARVAPALDDAVPTRAVPQGDGWRVSGRKAVVLGAPEADLLLVTAEERLLLVPADAPGVTRRAYPLVDGRLAADVLLEAVALPAEALLAEGAAARLALEEMELAGALACVAEMAGAMEAALERTIAHLRLRVQFGAPLATQQALRHRVADMSIACEETAVLGWRAAQAFEDPATRALAVAAAMAQAGAAALRVCEEAVQLHGATAIVDEFPVGHFLKRVVVAERLFGNSEDWLERVAGGLGIVARLET